VGGYPDSSPRVHQSELKLSSGVLFTYGGRFCFAFLQCDPQNEIRKILLCENTTGQSVMVAQGVYVVFRNLDNMVYNTRIIEGGPHSMTLAHKVLLGYSCLSSVVCCGLCGLCWFLTQ
jgi:hypothetical protein